MTVFIVNDLNTSFPSGWGVVKPHGNQYTCRYVTAYVIVEPPSGKRLSVQRKEVQQTAGRRGQHRVPTGDNAVSPRACITGCVYTFVNGMNRPFVPLTFW